MIPKIIHYCWFGRNPIPQSVKTCIDSWKCFCPDYDIFFWNEDNFDISAHQYMVEAYEAQQYAFVSDLARLIIVYENGGVYLDTDVELIKSLDEVVDKNSFFFAIEKATNIRDNKESIHVATGLGFGAEKKNEVVGAMIAEYLDLHFKLPDNTLDRTPCPVRNSRTLEPYGWHGEDKMIHFKSGTIYPSEYFCPVEFSSDIKHFTKNTISIHHYNASWKTRKEKKVAKMKTDIKKMLRIFGGVFGSSTICTILQNADFASPYFRNSFRCLLAA